MVLTIPFSTSPADEKSVCHAKLCLIIITCIVEVRTSMLASQASSPPAFVPGGGGGGLVHVSVHVTLT